MRKLLCTAAVVITAAVQGVNCQRLKYTNTL